MGAAQFNYQGRIIAIVQARMASTRLPGKSMIRLRERPVIEHVLRRVRRAEVLSEVVLATSEQPDDDVLCDVADRLGVLVFRGPERDVLKRYVLVAQEFGANVVVRVCADNPLVAPEEIDRIVRHHLRTGADYSFNHRAAFDNQYPNGLGAEVVNFEVLKTIDQRAVEYSQREHVTAYIWDNLGEFQVQTVVAPPTVAGPEIKLDMDTEADLGRLQELLSKAPCEIEEWSAIDIVRTYRQTAGNAVARTSTGDN